MWVASKTAPQAHSAALHLVPSTAHDVFRCTDIYLDASWHLTQPIKIGPQRHHPEPPTAPQLSASTSAFRLFLRF